MNSPRSHTVWVTKTQAAELVGFSPRHFGDAIYPRLSAGAVRGRGPSLRFNAAAVVDAHVAREVERAAKVADDPLLTGADSPALERYRLARAKMAEKDLAEREADTINLTALGRAVKLGIAAMRKATDTLRSRFGNEAAEIYTEGVDALALAVDKAVSPK